MATYFLYRFDTPAQDLTDEFVIISDLPEAEIRAEYGDWLDRAEITSDAISFPCDRKLHHRF